MAICFISYSRDSKEHKQWVERLASALMRAGIEVIYDQDRGQNPPGGDISEFIGRGIERSDFLVIVCTPEYVLKANSVAGFVGYETVAIRERLRTASTGFRILPVLREGSDMPSYLKDRNYFDVTDDAQFTGQVTRLLLEMDALGDGIAPRDIVFGADELPGQVFAIELLNAPVWLKRDGDRTFVTVSRAGVELAVFTGDGRRKVIEVTFPEKGEKERAQNLDRSIHRFLLHQTEQQQLAVNQPNLRWASGGVLSKVTYQGRLWFPFFFRDIPPYGWNICLGASEDKNDNLNDPWSFVMREFLEETLVCQRSDRGPEIVKRPFVFDRVNAEAEMVLAEDLSRKHQRLRFERDGITFTSGLPVYVDLWHTKTELQIIGEPRPLRNVLVCLNITELGIEVIKVISYELGDFDYILDGEIYEPGRSQKVELVRMPVALISYEFLQSAFGGKAELEFRYEDQLLPSILSPTIPKEHIHIFEQDVLRRRDIALRTNTIATDWERERYTLWYDQFGRNFFDSNNNPTNMNACRLFTPTSAKSLGYYFANEELGR